jgi:hypothetical protein
MTSKLTRSHDEYLDAILKDGDKAELLQALQRFRTLGINSNIKLGSLLAQFGAEAGGLDLDITRDPTPAEPASFE